MCLWQTVGDDSYVHISWSMSLMVGENGYWLCPWQMVVEDGYVPCLCPWQTVMSMLHVDGSSP